jgi:hypothetical protein
MNFFVDRFCGAASLMCFFSRLNVPVDFLFLLHAVDPDEQVTLLQAPFSMT